MSQIHVAKRLKTVLTILASIIILSFAQVTEFTQLYGTSPNYSQQYPLQLVSDVFDWPNDYRYRVNNIAIYETSDGNLIFPRVNSRANFATTITSGPCASKSLQLAPQYSSSLNHPNPLILSATAYIVRIQVFFETAQKTGFMTRIDFCVLENGVETIYRYGTGSHNGNWWWFNTTSPNQEFVGVKIGLPSSGATCELTGFSIYTRPIPNCATESISRITAWPAVNQSDYGSLILATGAAQTQGLYYQTDGWKKSNPCPVTYNLAVAGPNPSLITLSGNTISFAASSSLADGGVYTLTVTAQINGQSIWSSPSIATFEYFSCNLTKITGSTYVQNLVSFAGYKQITSQSYFFNDTVSFARTPVGAKSDFCGNKTFRFQIDNISTSLLSGANLQALAFRPSVPQSFIGTKLATLQVCMQDYPQVCNTPIGFNVTTIAVQSLTSLTQNYQVGHNLTSFSYVPFKILPEGFKSSPPFVNTLQAYLQKNGTVLVSPLDGTNSNLTLIQDLSWIQFNAETCSFQVQTSDNQFVGTWTLVVVMTIDQFPGAYFNSSIQLKVAEQSKQTTISANSQVPSFNPPIISQVVNKIPWTFTLPQVVDPSNSTVNISVVFTSKDFTYDPKSQTITQNNALVKPGNQTIQITLSDSTGQQATYPLQVSFAAEVKKNATNETSGSNDSSSFVFNASQYSSRATKKNTADTNNASNTQSKTKTRASAQIKQIDPYGQLTVQFSEKITIPTNYTQQIQNGTLEIDGVTQQNLVIKVQPGKLSNLTLVTLTNWTIQSFSSTQLIIQLNFENPAQISLRSAQPDSILVQMNNLYFFADYVGDLINPSTLLQMNLPPMASRKALNQAQAIGNAASNTLTGAFVTNFIVLLLIAGPLQQIFSSIKTLQVILSQMLVNVTYPAVANVYLGLLMGVSTFQIIDFTQFYNNAFKLDDAGNDPLTYQFGVMGYNSRYIIQNFGTLCWTAFYTPLVYLIFKLLHCGKWEDWFPSLENSLKKRKMICVTIIGFNLLTKHSCFWAHVQLQIYLTLTSTPTEIQQIVCCRWLFQWSFQYSRLHSCVYIFPKRTMREFQTKTKNSWQNMGQFYKILTSKERVNKYSYTQFVVLCENYY